MSDGTDTGFGPALGEWPATGLETLGRCPVCGSSARALRFEGLRDGSFGVAPGAWRLWTCDGCGSGYLDPRPDRDSIGLAYRSYVTHGGEVRPGSLVPGGGRAGWARRLAHHGFYDRFFGHALRPAAPGAWLLVALSAYRRTRAAHHIRHLPGRPGPPARLLDLGCGDGSFLRIARALGFEVEGLEPDPKAAAVAREAGLPVFGGTLEEARYPQGRFDHVTMSHVVEHLHEPVRVLSQVHDLLAPAGRIWIQTPNLEASGLRRFGASWRGLEPPRHLVVFGPKGLEIALRAAGFTRPSLLPPPPDAMYYLAQSMAMQLGRDPYRANDRDLRRQLRSEARRMDRAAARDPARGETITMVAYRPG